MQDYLIEMLVCPACHGELVWEFTRRAGERIEEAEARCSACRAVYPVREDIGVFLTPDLPRNDLWEQVDSEMSKALRENPQVEAELMDAPLENLSPADRFFRSMIYEERGQFTEAKAVRQSSTELLYSRGYLSCAAAQVDFVIAALGEVPGPVVDIATGQGYLVEEMLRRTPYPIVATDFSPRILRRLRRWFQFFGLYERLSLLAFDARRTPFKDHTVQTLTTYQGLANIENPGALLSELRRITRGVFLACSLFYPEDDQENGAVIRRYGLDGILYSAPLLEGFTQAGWDAQIANACVSTALPTPPSVLFEGARIDGLPVAETYLEWGVVAGK